MLIKVSVHDIFIKEWVKNRHMTKFKVYVAIRSLLTEKTTFCRLSDVVNLTKLTKAQATKAIKELIIEGHFKVVRDKYDRRHVLIYKNSDTTIIKEKINKDPAQQKHNHYIGVTEIFVKETLRSNNVDLRRDLYFLLINKHYKNMPIVRKELSRMTGVYKASQKRYAKEYVKTKNSFALINDEIVKKYKIKAKGKFKEINEGEIYIQIGNRYEIDEKKIKIGREGSEIKSKRAKRFIRGVYASFYGHEAYKRGTGSTRLFGSKPSRRKRKRGVYQIVRDPIEYENDYITDVGFVINYHIGYPSLRGTSLINNKNLII